LKGQTFAIKDNIDLANAGTTAGCAAFRYVPSESALAVQRLVDAGAIPIGKTNLDQFATGLNGTRSPYGTPQLLQSGFHQRRIEFRLGDRQRAGAGGFRLGTDTAGLPGSRWL
jgi:allophanate hydrolase